MLPMLPNILMWFSGDGVLLNVADGEEAWLRTKFDAGETSREPLALRPLIPFVNEIC